MRIFSLVIILIAISYNSAFAQSCTKDHSGTVPTEEGRGLPDSTWCFDCRDLSQFPEDFTNKAWNYTQHGDAAFTFGYYHESLSAGLSESSTMAVRSCNPMGQCATTMVTVNFNILSLDLVGVPAGVRTSVHSYDLVTITSDGDNHQVTHFPQVTSQANLPVPVSDEDDGHESGDCLDNDGDAEGESTYDPNGSDGGGSGGGGAGGAGGGATGGGGIYVYGTPTPPPSGGYCGPGTGYTCVFH